MVRASTPDDFWSKPVRQPNGCWDYPGNTTRPGWHARPTYQGRPWIASRLAWVLLHGPLPAHVKVCHSCDNPRCVNPDHLFLGSQRANMQDAGRKGRLGAGKNATYCKRGHPFEGNTYIHPVTGRRSCHECIRLRNAWRQRDAARRMAEAVGR